MQPIASGSRPARPTHQWLHVIRSLVFFLALTLTVIPWAFVVCGGALFLSKPKRYWLAMRWVGWAIYCARAICGIRYRVLGWENLPNEPAIVLCKHQSAWETLWLPTLLPRRLSFVYKRELHWVPFFGWGLASLGMVNINRAHGQNAFEQVVAQGSAHLQDGWWIAMFPEGTRTAPGQRRRYKSGGARLAVRTGAKIIPIALNSGEYWPRNAFIKRPGEITVSILPTIDPAGKTADQVAASVEQAIEDEMHRRFPHHYRAGSHRASGPPGS
ncbi:MAG TPA: lysophospholipid acyltransferase family protein [Burkholderiaceae bacterium]|nr:lysophospholipid acyltransferase family protein [Burkholderiaceae bacterium]